MPSSGLHLSASVAAREKRLLRLLAERQRRPEDPSLREVVEDAQVLGSLELTGFRVTWDDVRSSRVSGDGPPELLALRRARAAVEPGAPLTVAALREWHSVLAGPVGFRREDHAREGTPVAPVELLEDRLASLAEWLGVAGDRDLRPEQAGALALARIVEVRPFEDGNGRVSRLAASHLMVRGGMRPPILVAGDGTRLRAALEAAFRLETEPLVTLLVEASGRALDVMIQALVRGEV
jgi:hypothetical protein